MNTTISESKSSARPDGLKSKESLQRAFDLCVRKTRGNIKRLADDPKSAALAVDGNYFAFNEGFYEIGNWTSSFFTGMALLAWRANPNKYATAKSLEGPWSEFKDIAPPEINTYGSQSTMMLKVAGTKTTTVIFMGDIWKPQTQWDSRYLWMPLEIGDGKLWLPEPKDWTLNIKTGRAVIKE